MSLKAKNKLKNKTVLIIAIIGLFFSINSLSQQITWQRTYDGRFHDFDVAEGVCDAGNGNIFLVGTSQRPSSYSSIFVIKINMYGDTIWTKYIDSAVGKAVTPSGDGGCVITGVRYEAFTAKLDSSGNLIWLKQYTNNIVFSGYDIVKTPDGGYICCGTAFYNRGYIFKIDESGNLEWSRYYTEAYGKYFERIENAIDGGYLVAGTLRITSNDTPRGLITKIDTGGTIIWEKNFVYYGNTGVHDMAITINGYVLSGNIYDGNFRVFNRSIDINGNEKSTKIFQSNENESLSRLRVISPNKYVMSLSKLNTSFPIRYYSKLITTDSSGNIVAEKIYDALGDLYIYSILPMSNGDIMFIGSAEYYVFPIQADVYALRTDSLLIAPPPIGIQTNNSGIPIQYELYQNYPNPFNPATMINYALPKQVNVSIKIYDLTGRLIKILVNETKSAGYHSIPFDGSVLASGVYFYKIEAGDFVQSKKMVLIK